MIAGPQRGARARIKDISVPDDVTMVVKDFPVYIVCPAQFGRSSHRIEWIVAIFYANEIRFVDIPKWKKIDNIRIDPDKAT